MLHVNNRIVSKLYVQNNKWTGIQKIWFRFVGFVIIQENGTTNGSERKQCGKYNESIIKMTRYDYFVQWHVETHIPAHTNTRTCWRYVSYEYAFIAFPCSNEGKFIIFNAICVPLCRYAHRWKRLELKQDNPTDSKSVRRWKPTLYSYTNINFGDQTAFLILFRLSIFRPFNFPPY